MCVCARTCITHKNYMCIYIYTQSALRNRTHIGPHGLLYGADMGAPYGARENLSLKNKWGLCGPIFYDMGPIWAICYFLYAIIECKHNH